MFGSYKFHATEEKVFPLYCQNNWAGCIGHREGKSWRTGEAVTRECTYVSKPHINEKSIEMWPVKVHGVVASYQGNATVELANEFKYFYSAAASSILVGPGISGNRMQNRIKVMPQSGQAMKSKTLVDASWQKVNLESAALENQFRVLQLRLRSMNRSLGC